MYCFLARCTYVELFSPVTELMMNVVFFRYGPLHVGGCPSEILDETHCFWVMCPHPCCWEAEQRVARGVARRVQSRTPGRSNVNALSQECPTLNVVNVSEWAKTRKPPKENMLYRAFSSESCHPVTSQSQLCSQSQNFLKDSNIRLERLKDLHFPECTSAAKSPHSTNYKHNKDVKLSLAQISPLDRSSGALCGSVSMVMWIPNPNRVSHDPAHHRRKSSHVGVRNIACVPSSLLCDIPKPNRKESRNIQKTEHLQQTCTQLASPNGKPRAPGHMVSQIVLHTADVDLTNLRGASTAAAEAELAAGGNRGVLQPKPEPEPWPGPRPGEPDACPAAERERGPRREPAQRTLPRLARCTLGSANVAEGIDWLRLKSQTHLWKKRDLRQDCGKDRPVLAPPHPPHHWAGTHRLSKATLHHHHRSALEIGPAVCRCAECAEEMRGCGGDGRSDFSAAGGFPKLSQGSAPMRCSSLQPLDADDIGDRKPSGGDDDVSRSSVLEPPDTAATLQGTLGRRVTIGQKSGGAGRGSGRSLSRGTEGRDSGSDSGSEDEDGDFGPSESRLSAPPPSLRSDFVD
ncbi:uncharacterized protein LOC118207040 isoform X2 [Anguilla anguilla]|uniref:uncharacterized protein LOC118207040 isoform X2 n=1 Tax=Anguilla anguilla TaxID=7936 RepID=UPI0015AD3B80|nr:uncharacterized protein LOC118207040 isoform X2 [Anguilla anguilla]